MVIATIGTAGILNYLDLSSIFRIFCGIVMVFGAKIALKALKHLKVIWGN